VDGHAGQHFADRLSDHVARRGSQIVLGLDPDPARLWPQASASRGSGAPASLAAVAVLDHCEAVLDAAGPACVAVKPQLACFERLGQAGWAALERVVVLAHERDLLVLADGKRGDIDVSAKAYAQALLTGTDTPFGEVPGLGADAITANPLMGADTLAPLAEGAAQAGAGVFVLVRTSNPGAADVEDLELAGGGPLWHRLARLVARLGAERVGTSGLADIGAVVGATAPEHIATMRELMPHAIFLLPGSAPRAGAWRTWRPRSPPVARAASSPRRAPSSPRTSGRGARPRPPPWTRPSACATPRGPSRPDPAPPVREGCGAAAANTITAMPYRSPARWLAPLALLAFVLAVLLVVGSGTGGGDEASDAGDRTATQARTSATSTSTTKRSTPRRYTVKAGDTLSSIAEQTGVPLERIEELNPRARRADPEHRAAHQAVPVRRGALAVLAAAVAAVAPVDAAVARTAAAPAVRAPSAILVQKETGDVIFERRATDRRAIASTTKLMTALLALERLRLSQVVAAAPYAAAPVESVIGLRAGERLTVADLLRGLLLASANDAAVTLATKVSRLTRGVRGADEPPGA
jgi:orotidine-5'-phosphate decarboxylase